MKQTTIPLLVIFLIGAVVLFACGWYASKDFYTEELMGSVQTASEYHSTTTSEFDGGGQLASKTVRQIVANKSGVLGSVIIASTSVQTLKIKNATSTGDTASTTVAEFGVSPTVGVYTFDVVTPRGLIIEMPAGFDGLYTITFRSSW